MSIVEPDPHKELMQLKVALAVEQGKVRVLQEMAATIGSTLDLSEFLSMVVEQVSGVLDAERSTLFLLDRDAQELVAQVAQGGAEEIRLPIGQGIAGSAAELGQVVNVVDAYADPRFDPSWDERSGFRTRSVLAVPMRNLHGRILGVIQVLNKLGDRPFSESDVSMAEALAAQAAVSLENSKLFHSIIAKNEELLRARDRLEDKVRERGILFDITQIAARATEIRELVDEVLARTMSAVDADVGAVLLFTGESGADLHIHQVSGAARSFILQVEHDEGFCGWVATHDEPAIVDELSLDPRVENRHQLGLNARAAMAVPLRWEGGGGALAMFDTRQHSRFGGEDLRLLQIIGGAVATSIGLSAAAETHAREARLHAIGQSLSGIMHDLKTPMTVISGYAELLADEEDAGEREKLSEGIGRQVRHIKSMTREMLAFARGDRKVWFRKVYLAPFFEDLGEQIARSVEGSGIAFHLDLQERGVHNFDVQKITRAIHNLARNAIEAIGEGEGELSLRVSRDDEGQLVIEVHDDGPGIPLAVRARLFNSFATHGKRRGTGLGLAMVRTAVEDHRGTIEVDSVRGATMFRMSLPNQVKPDETA